MRADISFITLAVDDLGRSVGFYRDGLGWRTEGIVGQQFHDEVTGADGTSAFFALDGDLMFGLYQRTNLAKDASLPVGPPSSTEFSLGIPAESQAEVDSLLRQVEAAAACWQHPPICARLVSTPGTSPTRRSSLRDRLELQPVEPHTRHPGGPRHRIRLGRHPR